MNDTLKNNTDIECLYEEDIDEDLKKLKNILKYSIIIIPLFAFTFITRIRVFHTL